jgi:hypothetical protein
MSRGKAQAPGRAPRGGYFARRPVRPGELPAIMRRHIFTGCLGSAWNNLITGIIYVYFGNAVGMTQLQWGILNGVAAWVVVAQPLGAIVGERAGSRKLVWFWSAFGDRLTRLLAVIGAYLLYRAGHPWAYLVFMAGICLGCVPGNFANGPWYGWLTTIIPQEVQGSFWGRRDSWIALAVIAVVLPSGLVMDLVPAGSKLETAALILAAASAVGFLDVLIHGTIPEPPVEARGDRTSLAEALTPLRDRRFRPWLTFVVLWNFVVALAGSLATLYFMANLGFRDNLLAGMLATSIANLAGMFVGGRTIGRMVDRYGTKRTLFMSHFFWAFIPLIWCFATPASALFVVGTASFIGGVFINAAANASIKLVTRFTTPERSGMYMAVSTTASSVAAGLGSIAAGAFLQALGGWSFTVLGLVVSAFPLLFVLSGALRFVVVFVCIPRVRATTARRSEEEPFLLPLFFREMPGISRIARAARAADRDR